jgi:hypothetical protein
MLNPLLAASSLLLLFAAPATSPAAMPWAVAPLPLQQHVTIHVPRMTVTTTTTFIVRSARPVVLVEKKAGDCVGVEKIAGFRVNRFDSVDLVMRDGAMMRAKLGSDCPALGFYSGFYVKANKDKKICAKRDAFRSRSGRSCDIQRFTALVAQP